MPVPSAFNKQSLVAILLCLLASTLCQAWIPSSQLIGRQQVCLSSTASGDSNPAPLATSDDGDDDDEEYEYVEYEMLTESEFLGSEWLVGTVSDNNANKIVETWARLAVDKDGKKVAIWGDNAEGTWNFDTSNQFLSVSKENLMGKKIWAGVVDDYYYMQGTVRGWNFLSAAAVVGQWQAKRLGVDPDEAGVAPWFEPDDEEETEGSEKQIEGSDE